MSNSELAQTSPESLGVSRRALADFFAGLQEFDPHHILVVLDGKLIARAVREPYRMGSRHMTHSMTKSFTGTGVGLAVAAGLFGLDDLFVTYFPEYADSGGYLAEIRVRDLLTMTAGHSKGSSGASWRPLPGSWLPEAMRMPVTERPGTHFQYGSAASFLLSALVGRLAGVSLHDYLRERVFAPLGISGEQWDADPSGINSGGNGLLVKPEDVAKLGLLHLDGGVWNGQRLLPSEWVRAATSAQVSFPPERWDQYTYEPHASGYGYHWWIGPGGAYYASGVFGQYCAVLPASRAVIVVNAGAKLAEAHLMLDRIWEFGATLRAGEPVGEDTAAGLAVVLPRDEPTPANVTPPLLAGERLDYQAAPNEDGITEFRLCADDTGISVEVVDQDRSSVIRAGFGSWTPGHTALPGASLHHEYDMATAPVACKASWLSCDTLSITCAFTEAAFVDTLVFQLNPKGLRYDRSVNTNSAQLRRPTVVAALASPAGNPL
ncbi:MAG: beta-lactamase family protein [Propionibacteriaceae bacterium]|jgi:CubicO group peptidase (beta-lactamase class C family)|nr:beta-lactamase family protein [Propionibacteriaceae bacterium]